MTKPTYCYFLCFRTRRYEPYIDWEHPTGGLVMLPVCVIGETIVSDPLGAMEILEERYHCSPQELLIVAEAREEEEQKLAATMHEKWQTEVRDFDELMGGTGKIRKPR